MTNDEALLDYDLVVQLPPKLKYFVLYESLYPLDCDRILEAWDEVSGPYGDPSMSEDELQDEIIRLIRENYLVVYRGEPTALLGMYEYQQRM